MQELDIMPRPRYHCAFCNKRFESRNALRKHVNHAHTYRYETDDELLARVARLPSDLRKRVPEVEHDTPTPPERPESMQIITINMPRAWVKWLDGCDTYPSRSEAIRVAVREFIIKQAAIDAFLEGEQ